MLTHSLRLLLEKAKGTRISSWAHKMHSCGSSFSNLLDMLRHVNKAHRTQIRLENKPSDKTEDLQLPASQLPALEPALCLQLLTFCSFVKLFMLSLYLRGNWAGVAASGKGSILSLPASCCQPSCRATLLQPSSYMFAELRSQTSGPALLTCRGSLQPQELTASTSPISTSSSHGNLTLPTEERWPCSVPIKFFF